MALKFVWSNEGPGQGVLRSIGDPPNGLVGFVSTPEGGTVIVSPLVDPEAPRSGQRFIGSHEALMRELQETEVDAEDAVDACADHAAAMSLYNLTAGLLVLQARHELPRGNFEHFRLTLDAAEDLCDKIEARWAS